MGKLAFNSKLCTTIVLCLLFNVTYMDRYTLASVLNEVQLTFEIDDDLVGLFFTVYIIADVIVAPLFGYLSDRYNRRFLLISSLAISSLGGFCGSFAENYWLLLFSRVIVGVGQTAWIVIAPSILSDFYVDKKRTIALTVMMLSIPLGSGLGFVCGAKMAAIFKSWRYALRFTLWFAIVGIIILFVVYVPKRGESETKSGSKNTHYMEDLRHLQHNKTYIFITLAMTCINFVCGAVSWWGAQYLFLAFQLAHAEEETWEAEGVAFQFGVLLIVAGVCGLPIGGVMSEVFTRFCDYGDPLLVGGGLLLSLPFLISVIFLCTEGIVPVYCIYAFALLAMFFININWAVSTGITLYVVIPTRRGTTLGIQHLGSHMLGDVISPYLVGILSVQLKQSGNTSNELSRHVHALQISLLLVVAVEILGSIFALICIRYVSKDRQDAMDETALTGAQ